MSDKKSSASGAAGIPTGCPVDTCGAKVKRSVFCLDHFEWFKVGLINRQGQKPKDFDKKFQAYKRRQGSKAS